MDVSIIIPVYQRQGELEALLNSLSGSVPKSFEVETLIVEDGSPVADKPKLQEQYGRIGARFILNERNMGPAYSRNRGAKEATGRYFWFIDSDVIADRPDTLGALIAALEEDPKRLATGGVIEQVNGTEYFMQPKLLPAFHYLYEKVPPSEDYDEVVDFLSTANFFISKRNFLTAGGFDPNLNIAEDNEFCVRLQRVIGGNFHQSARTFVLHDISDRGRDTGTLGYSSDRRAYIHVKFKARNLLLRRHLPWRLVFLPFLEAVSLIVYYMGIKADRWHLARVDKAKTDAAVITRVQEYLLLFFYMIVGMGLLFTPASHGKRMNGQLSNGPGGPDHRDAA